MRKNKGNLSTKNLAYLGMLLAITIILGMFFTIRPDPYTKIPTKFIPIAIASMLFGPFWGGILGALADLISYSLNPMAGALLPQITLIEFLYGFTYGLFLKNIADTKMCYVKVLSFTFLQVITLHVFLTTLLLVPVYGVPFWVLFALRIPGFIINTVLQILGIFFIVKFSKTLKKISGGIR